MKSVQSTFNEYFYNLFISVKINRKKFLFILLMVWIAIVISRFVINNFRQYYHITHVMDTCGVVIVNLLFYPLIFLIAFMVVVLFLPSRYRAILTRLNKATLHLNMRKVKMLFFMFFYISMQLAIIFSVTGIGYLIKRYTFNGAFNLFFLSVILVYYVIVMSLAGLLMLSLLNIYDYYGVRYVKASIPCLIKHVKSKVCKIVNPEVVYNDFKIAGSVAIPIILIMTFSHTYDIYVLSFEKIYIGMVFGLFVLGIIVIFILDKMTAEVHKDYKHVLDPFFNKIKIFVRSANFALMLSIVIYIAFLLLNMQLSMAYWSNISGKIFDVVFLTIIFEIFAPSIQVFSKSIHIRKIKYKPSMAKK